MVFLTAIGLILSNWIETRSTSRSHQSTELNQGKNSYSTEKSVLIVGGDNAYPPYSYLKDGVAQGFDNDLIRAVAQVMGVNVEFNLTSWAEAQQNLLDGKVDLLSGIAYSKAREQLFDFANPHSVHYYDVFVRSNSKIKSLDDLKGKQIVVQNGDIMQEYLQGSGLSGSISTVTNPEEALRRVSSGDCDGTFLNKIIGYYYINSDEISNLRGLNLQVQEQSYGFAVQKGNTQLVQKLNEALAIVDATGEYEVIRRKWFSTYQQQSLVDEYRYYIYGLVALISLFFLVILWVWSLRRQVARKTRELSESEQKYSQLIDSATEGVGVVVDDNLVYLNPEALTILGLKSEPIFPLDVRKFIHPEDLSLIQANLQNKSNQGKGLGPIYHRIIQEDGNVRWIKSNAREIVWDSKPALLSVFSDVTEARSLEEAIKDSEKRFRVLFDKTPVGLFYFNTDLVITLANDQLKKILHLTDEELNNFDLKTIEDQRIMPALLAILNLQEGSYRGGYRLVKSKRYEDVYINLRTTPILNENHELQGGIGLIEDITEVTKSENKLHSLEDRFTKAFLTSPDSLNINRLRDGLYLDINQGFTDLTGYTRDDVMGKTSLELDIWVNPEDRTRLVNELQNHGEVKNLEAEFRLKDGSVKTGLMSAALIEVNGEKSIISITRDISDRKIAENLIRENEIRYRTIFQSVPVSIWEQDFLKVYDMLEDLRAAGITDLIRYLSSHPDFVRIALKTIRVKDVNEVTIRMFEAQCKEDLLGPIDHLFDREAYQNFEQELLAIWDHRRSYEGETVNRTLDGKRMDVSISITIPETREEFSSVLVSLTDITQRKKAEAALRESESRYKSIFNSVPVSIWEEDFSRVNNFLNDLRENGVKDLDLYLRQHPQVVREAASMIVVNEVNDATVTMFSAESKTDLMQSLEKVFTEEAYDNFRREMIAIWNKQPSFYGETTNLTLDGREITISISTTIPQESEEYSRVFVSIEDITERKKAEDQIRRQVKHLASLRAVDMAISASIDLPITLRVLINQAVQQLSIDAASILLFNPDTQMLVYAAGSGFSTRSIEDTGLKLGESYAGKAALERRMIAANDLRTQHSQLKTINLDKEGFTDYIGVPLIAKGKVKGVLELFNRTPLPDTVEWMSLLDSMAGQAAIAIDNATLFDEVQQANNNLRRAYDATIEGWARALELRDGETEGHSARVADMTVKLAQAFKIKGDALVDIRRGSLLHDIGKMGIPDHILLKNGPLTEDEWQIMRKHPEYAKRLLGSIDFLKGAVEIPYNHHERWDGSGYPQGLKGEGIPLASRVFAVVDSWDALRSDRPYRKAWTDMETWNHIEKNSGKEYDPKVVEKFRQLLISLNYLPKDS